MTRRYALGLVLLLLPLTSAAQVAEQATEAEPTLYDTTEPEMDVVVVSTVYAGPAMWKVTSGDHVMWILGEVSPYPRKWKWKSKEFERVLGRSQELLIDFSGYWWVEEENSAVLNKAAILPEGSTLKDVIAPDLYARVQKTAAKFGKPALEKLRPFSATNRLVTSAMKKLDLSGFSARFEAARLGEWRQRKVTFFAAKELHFEDRLKNWQSPANEICLKRLVDTIDDGGTGALQLANAWAVGDIPALEQLVPLYSFSRDGFRAGGCADAMHGGEQQARDYKIRRTQSWLAEAERALKKNKSTIAVVLMSELFANDGYLAALRAKGYQILEPR